MKISKVFQFFCIFVLVGCAPGNIKQPVETLTSVIPPLLVSPSPVPPSPIAPTQTAPHTPASYSKIIGKENLNQLALLRSWDVEGIYFYNGANFWFSDSDQFIILNSDGVQSFKVNDLTRIWSFESLAFDFTIDENDQILINLKGLQIFNKQGVEIQTIRTNHFCDIDEPPSNYILAIPGTKLVVTGQQDSYSDFGLNGVAYDKARILIWDISKNSCSELIKQFDGHLSSLSVSEDGRYISYIVVIKTTDTLESTTHIYDLNLRKEKCKLADGYNYTAHFTRGNQLAVYDSRDGIISVMTLANCTTKTKFNTGTEIVNAFAISPNGELLAGVTDDAIHFWDLQTGEKLREIDPKGYTESIIGFSPDGHFLVTAKEADSLAEKDKVMLWGIP